MEAEILNISSLPYVLKGKGNKARASHVHRQTCISNYRNEVLNKTSMNIGNTTHNMAWVLHLFINGIVLFSFIRSPTFM